MHERARNGSSTSLAVYAVIALLAYAYPPEANAQQVENKEQSEEPSRAEVSTLNERDEPDQTAWPCEPDKPNRRSDLCAQWKAADAAAESAVSGWWQVYIGIAGGALGLLTLAAAVAAAVFAGKAAKVAKAALQNEFRPWVKVGYVAIHVDDRVSVAVDIVNVGRSSTVIDSSHVEVWLGPDLPMVRPYQGLCGSNPFTKDEIMPGHSKSARVSCVPTKAGTPGEPLKIYVMGWVRYLDHGIPRRTMFCRVYDPSTGRLVPTNDPDYEVQH